MHDLEPLNISAEIALTGKTPPDKIELVKTYKFRVRDKHARFLRRQAKRINWCWNTLNWWRWMAARGRIGPPYALPNSNIIDQNANRLIIVNNGELRWRATGQPVGNKWLSGYDLSKFLKGLITNQRGWRGEMPRASLDRLAEMIAMHCEEARDRNGKKRPLRRLKHRPNDRNHKDWKPGFLPLKARSIKPPVDGKIHIGKHKFEVLPEGPGGYVLEAIWASGKCAGGTFDEEGRGIWSFNLSIKAPAWMGQRTCPAIGIDPGRNKVMTINTGDVLDIKDLWYPDLEERIKTLQKARRFKIVATLHRKIVDKRKHAQYAWVEWIISELNPSCVFIGAWAPPARGKVKGAKGARRGSLATLKNILARKCQEAGIPVFEVNEAYSSKTCSACGCQTEQVGGIDKLGVRAWTCEHCGAEHDRDVNAAQNILKRGLALLRAAHAPKRQLQRAA